MKVLTLTQPWATLVAIGAKRIETRSWETKYIGRLIIHAAKGFPADCRELCMEEPFRSVLTKAGYLRVHERKATDLPLASVVAVCHLIECLPTEDLTEQGRTEGFHGFPEYEPHFGNYDAGRFAFVLSHVHALRTPIPARGALGLWVPPTELVQTIGAQLHAQQVAA